MFFASHQLVTGPMAVNLPVQYPLATPMYVVTNPIRPQVTSRTLLKVADRIENIVVSLKKNVYNRKTLECALLASLKVL